ATPVITATIVEAGSVNVTLTAADPDGPTLTFAAFAPTNGTLGPVNQGVLTNGTATVTFTHDGSETLSASFDFNATDGIATSAAGTVNITVTPQNDVPVATPVITTTMLEGGSVVATLTATDEDGDVLTFNAFAPVNGSVGTVVQGAADQQATVTFTHDGSETTTASFDFNASDGTATSGAGTVTITVTPQNDPPTANAVSPGVLEGGPVTFTLTGSDVDGDSLTFSLFGGGPSNGSITSGPTPVTTTSASITYQHNGSETLTDSFQFRVNDGTGFSAPATVSVVVTPVNDPPVVTAVINETVAEGGAVNVTLTGSDPDGPTLSFSAFSQTNGTLGPVNQGVLTDGQAVVTYTHNGSSTSSAEFSFNATDGSLVSAAGTVNLTVTGVNDPPVPTPGLTAVVDEGGSVVVTLTATDEDGDVLTFNAFAPVNGSVGSVVQGAADQQATVTFTHDGSETTTAEFDFNATDGQAVSAAGTVNLTVTPVDDPPVAVPDSPAAVGEDSVGNVFDVLANDTDSDGGPKSVASVTDPANGSVVNNGSNVTYAPDANYCGPDSFSYTLTPGSSSALVSVTVTCSDDPPTVELSGPFDLAAAATDGTLIGTPLTFTDPELDPATGWTIDPADDPGGFFAISVAGQLSLTANGVGNLVGSYVLSITVDAGGLTSTPVDFTINIT
ncbi:MAG: tandem-95 repeat protein, partial [Acidimicrobiia bacterium]|nr:tandem-95 repeat protein [Acidimicrobiia bacterium]